MTSESFGLRCHAKMICYQSECKAAVPTSHQTISPTNEKGGGEAKFCIDCPPGVKIEPEIPMSCAGCTDQILDKYYMKVDGRSWHEKCVSCGSCQQPLSDSCFSRNCKLYCKECYKQLQYCYRCSGPISGTELVMRVSTDSYHVSCFSCDYCNRQLNSGDHFHSLEELEKRKICCKICYDIDDVSNLRVTESDSEESLNDNDVFGPGMYPPPASHPFMPSSAPPAYNRQLSDYPPGLPHPHMQGVGIPCGKNGKSPSSSSMLSPSDSKRSKRPRTILTTAQRRKFKASFEISQKPCRKVRETLANETGLTPRVVQVWFQNQRAKMKKIARRQNQGEGGSRRGKRKKDCDSDSENEVPSSPGSYTSAPTPHQQSQYYAPDQYQSPRSLQSTPTQDDPNVPRLFSPVGYHQPGFNHSELQYPEEYDSSSTHHSHIHMNPSPTTSHSPSQLEMHGMLYQRIGGGMLNTSYEHPPLDAMQHDDVDLHRNEAVPMVFHGTINQDPYATQRHQDVVDISRERTLVSASSAGVSNPIDSLMCMQNNFFTSH
ncbi:uncharacterized protein LOC120344452 isoform X1 [Styela clava]